MICFLIAFIWAVSNHCFGQDPNQLNEIQNLVNKSMDVGDIPGLTLAIVNEDQEIIFNYGYANLNKKIPVTNQTLFEIGSCTKAFTGLAILKLEQEGKLVLDSTVSNYLPWFKVYREGKRVSVTLQHLLYHTSGIPWSTISLIPEDNSENALENTVRKVNHTELNSLPGWKFEYATINYDILALILEKIVKTSYEDYIKYNIIDSLDLINTSIGIPSDKDLMATGYKINFLQPQPFASPPFRGNYAAGYIISNAEDMATWLTYQMGIKPNLYENLITKSHQRDESVKPINLSSYAYGWEVSLSGNQFIYHSGLNPNYSSFIAFNKNEKIGIALLANSNSLQTQLLGQNIINVLTGRSIKSSKDSGDPLDSQFTVICIVLSLFILLVLAFIGFIIYRILIHKRSYRKLTKKKLTELVFMLVMILPYLYGIYILPKAIANFTWKAIPIWTPFSFQAAIMLAIVAILLSFVGHVISSLFPEKNEYIKDAPLIILMSILAGLSNVAAILLITSSINSTMPLKYQLFYLVLTIMVYLIGVKVVRTKMTYLTRDIVYNLRIKLINLIFSTSYERFEKMDSGRVYTTLNGDVGTLGQSANMIVSVITNVITIAGSFIYMASLSFWATAITMLIVLLLSGIYYYVSKKSQHLFDESRETSTVYMGLLDEMIDGFKELSLHLKKKIAFKKAIENTANEFREKSSEANVKFINAFLVGESLLLFTLAVVAFAIQRIFPGVESYIIVSFIIILLYLIGPLNAILSIIPQILQLRIAHNRIKTFMSDIEPSTDLNTLLKDSTNERKLTIDTYSAKSICYEYGGEDHNFSVGPINLTINKGEVIFIIGGNGSGKTTLAKLLTGLYHPHNGEILIDGNSIPPAELGEYFSTVFSPFYLFKKLYSLNTDMLNEDIDRYLNLLEIEDKIKVVDNVYSTVNLSSGQRKRVALLQCYLEDKPIFLFDEWAADQDPIFRRLFYHELIPSMRMLGKTVIAITHDDQYFDVADKIYKMDNGKLKEFEPKMNVF
ncbi:cyclic peptide export ABC transporter [Fulvivirga sp. 29W222]|uniref:Cyclic peptide export ABC transporter n=1 Tax=Fulvivirga marina TaxID=2494733 RepID=A0A937KEU5_9BACT|nr:cyclic peptide export ABC transporter [Fulvivirga marina]MBL6447560.1 cyclic peptide export ABC transporter [Fulvivirga marina]